MTRLKFNKFVNYDDGKMACTETTGPFHIPLNIFIDNSEDYPSDYKQRHCFVDISGIGINIEIFENENDYLSANKIMDIISLIPTGTMPELCDDEDSEESPHILFSGKVIDIIWRKSSKESEANLCILVETLEILFKLYLHWNGKIEKGYIVQGYAWLFGNILFEDSKEEAYTNPH